MLTARARFVVDPRVVDRAHGRSSRRTSAVQRARRVAPRLATGLGRAGVVEFATSSSACSRACLPRGGGRAAAAEVVQLRPAAADAAAARRRDVARRSSWPAFGVQSRLTADEIGLSTPHAAATRTPPAVTWRISPGCSAASPSVAALLLARGRVAVASVVRRDTRLVRAPRIPAHLTPIERALALAEHAAAHGEVDESRKALERLAIELRRRRAVAQADDAERLAWSEPAALRRRRIAELRGAP